MKREIESATIKQAATMSAYALCSNDSANMPGTIVTLTMYKKSLAAVTDVELTPFAVQARKLVVATIKYLKVRSQANLTNAEGQCDKLSDMMTAYLNGGKVYGN